MKSNDLFWLLILVLLLVPLLVWFGRRRLVNKGGPAYKKETVPGLGPVDAIYQDGKLLWYDFEKNDVLIQINCQTPERRESALNAAKAITQADIEAHLQHAIAAIPADEIKTWGFDKGTWKMESVFINGPNYFILELGNSHDQDHCCRVIAENGKYEFECVDG